MLPPLRLRSQARHQRRVTWLELFFDLIFVGAVSQVAGPLHEHFGLAELARLAPLFVLIWLAWVGHTTFSTRFDSDDGVQRALTLVQMCAVAIMAANAKDALDSRSSAGFAAAYGAVHIVLVAQYARARHLPHTRRLTSQFLAGHGLAALVWLASALVPAPARFWMWGVAFAIDLGTPWSARQHSVEVPPDAAHLPERFGLFTLILLGETIIGVMKGMESQEYWSPAAATAAFLGMAIVFTIWWWYFDGAFGAGEQPVRSRRDLMRVQMWSYAHLPLYFGVVVAGAGIERLITAASHVTVARSDTALIIAAAATIMAAMTLIAATSPGRRERGSVPVLGHLAVAAATASLAFIPGFTSPALIIVVIASMSAAQLALALSVRRQRSARAAHEQHTLEIS